MLDYIYLFILDGGVNSEIYIIENGTTDNYIVMVLISEDIVFQRKC